MKRIYMITNRYNGKRFIGITDSHLCDVSIDNELLLKDIEVLKKNYGINHIRLIHIEELAIVLDDKFIDRVLDIYINQYKICGLYNKGILPRGVTEQTVINLDTGIDYDNASLAEKATGVSRYNIRRVCNKGKGTAGGFRWAYYKNCCN